MAERYDILARVISQKDTCAAGHKVSDKWVIKDRTPEGICLEAFGAICPTNTGNACYCRFNGVEKFSDH